MIILVTIIHVIVCLFLIVVVLLQSGKAGDISAAFGGQGSQAAFGPRGAATALSDHDFRCSFHVDIGHALYQRHQAGRPQVGVAGREIGTSQDAAGNSRASTCPCSNAEISCISRNRRFEAAVSPTPA
jgi:protein translocase SecG subunit